MAAIHPVLAAAAAKIFERYFGGYPIDNSIMSSVQTARI